MIAEVRVTESAVLPCNFLIPAVITTVTVVFSPVKLLDNHDKIATKMILLVMWPDGSQVCHKKVY